MPCPYRPELPPPPPEVASLPVDPVKKLPVPWFVAWIDGRPDFRLVDSPKVMQAARRGLCWVCGRTLHVQRVTFVIGPMCVVNRVSAEPPCHHACAEYAARACPFLARPHMGRREDGLPEGCEAPPGEFILRNPGVTCLWTTRAPGATAEVRGRGLLFSLWDPTALSWWREGRRATFEEVMDSVESGLPALEDMAKSEGPGAVAEFNRMLRAAAPRFATARAGR